MMAWIAYAVAWISTSSAVVYAIYITGKISPLWALLIPMCISIEITLKNGKGDKAHELCATSLAKPNNTVAIT